MELKLSFRPSPFDLECFQAIETHAAPIRGFSAAFSSLVSQTAAAPPDWREVQRHAVQSAAKGGPASNPITLSVDQEEWKSVRESINGALGIVRPRTSFLIRMTLVYGLMLSAQTEPAPLEVAPEQLDGLLLVEKLAHLLQSQDPADKAVIRTIASLLNNEPGGTL